MKLDCNFVFTNILTHKLKFAAVIWQGDATEKVKQIVYVCKKEKGRIKIMIIHDTENAMKWSIEEMEPTEPINM